MVSVVIPMFNEQQNARATVLAVAAALEADGREFELIPVDDGSTDGTAAELAALAAEFGYVRPVSYAPNRGRGMALRRGFASARGDQVVSIDADLSYSPDHIVRMVRELDGGGCDAVLASAYMPGGRTEGVRFGRLLASRLGNLVLRQFLPGRIHTATCVVRAYRGEAIRALELVSDGKEIHLEILSKLLALGYRVREIPAVLTARKRGASKFALRGTAASHLHFSLFERPIVLFGLAALAFVLAGLGVGLYLIHLWRQAALNPDRPLVILMVVLLLAGLQVLSTGFVAMQIIHLRNQLYLIQRQLRERDRSGPDAGGNG